MSDNMQSAALPFRQHTYEKKISTEGESYWLACKAVCHNYMKAVSKTFNSEWNTIKEFCPADWQTSASTNWAINECQENS